MADVTVTEADVDVASALLEDNAKRLRHGLGSASVREFVLDTAQAIARARAEGAASERELCAEAVEAVASRFRAAHDPVSENAADECYMAIRARGEGGAK